MYQLHTSRSPEDQPEDGPVFRLSEAHRLFDVDVNGSIVFSRTSSKEMPLSKGIDLIAIAPHRWAFEWLHLRW